MTSILKVNNIQSSASNAAVTIASSGALTIPQAVTFSGTVTGDNNGLELVSSSTTTQTGLTNLQITLPTTDDFHELHLIVRGFKSETATNNYWGLTLGDAGGSAINTGAAYKYMGIYGYSNGSSHGVTHNPEVTGGTYGRISAHFPGDGSDDTETVDMDIKIKHSNKSDRYTRINVMTGFEKRHTDAYITTNFVGMIRNAAEVNANINLFVTGNSAFTSYGYGLYKVKS